MQRADSTDDNNDPFSIHWESICILNCTNTNSASVQPINQQHDGCSREMFAQEANKRAVVDVPVGASTTREIHFFL